MEKLILFLSNGYTIITIIGAIVIFFYQQNRIRNERFKQYACDLYKEDNQTAQITSAILLRSYLRPIYLIFTNPYKQDTINLIVAILRHIPNGVLQKTLADGISYITNADGQDLQYINLCKCSIKPHYRIQYELTGDVKLLKNRISLRCADFYKAKIAQSGLYNINAEKSVFSECSLFDSTFHNCVLTDANFRNADVCNLRFKDCELLGANFAGARQLETVKVFETIRNTDSKVEIKERYLLDYLDEQGVFQGLQTERKYVVDKSPKKIFVSKLGSMNPQQKTYFQHLKSYLEEAFKYQLELIEPDEYPNSGQLEMITNRMSQCSGVLILAFSYMRVDNGRMVGLSKVIKNEEYISPWLHIEAALANALYKMPCMVITEKDVCCNGIFDEHVIHNEELMHNITYNGILSDSDENKLLQWSKAVDKYKINI